MKKIEATLRVEKLEEVTKELETLGYPGMTVNRVEGHGRQKGIKEQFRGREFKVDFIPKVKIEIIVHDTDVDRITSCICSAAHTGEVGDGKIFIYPVTNAIRIRTGEKGDSAI